MKKGLLYLGMMVLTMGFVTTNAMAQDVLTAGEAVTYTMPEMKLLAVTGTPPALTFVTPESGAVIADATSNGSWLHYTSIVDGVATNKIQVKISAAAPLGTTLTVVAAAPVGGNGTRGTQGSAVTLSITDQPLITAIGSCYTGTGATDGAQLTYTWSVIPGSFGLLDASPVAISTTYTILAGQ